MGYKGRITSWFIGEYLEANPDPFEKAKIRLTFNLAGIIILFLTPLLLVLLWAKLYLDSCLLLFALLIILWVPFILKYRCNYSLGSFLFSGISFLGLTISTLFEYDNIGFSNLPLNILLLLFVFFTLGRKWGAGFTLLSLILWSYYTLFVMKTNLQLEVCYTPDKIFTNLAVFIVTFSMIYYVITEYIKTREEAEERIKEANIQLEKSNKQLEELNKEMESFSYSVSHDLRAPLRSISGFTNIIESKLGNQIDDETRDCLRLIQTSATKMEQLIDSLLSLAKYGRQEIRLTMLDMRMLMDVVVAEIKESNPEYKVTFRIGSIHPVRGDALLMHQVLINLISNAVKYSQKKEYPEVEISSFLSEGEVIYCIKDNGAGFDMKYARKLFHPFQRLHDSSDFPGIGLGLTLVQRIVHRHGGRIWVEARPDNGAVFFFSIPSGITLEPEAVL